MNNIHTEIENLILGVQHHAYGLAKSRYGTPDVLDADPKRLNAQRETTTKAIEALLLDAQAEGYKRGYIAGGIDTINKHTLAGKPV